MVAVISCAHFCTPALAQIENAAALAEFFDSASSRRVDLLLIGDSNTLHRGGGWDHGWIKAAHTRRGLYATGLHSAGENGGLGSGVGYFAQTTSATGAGFEYSNAPQECDDFLKWPLPPQGYLYVATGQSSSGRGNHGMYVSPGGPLNVSAALNFHYSFVGFPQSGPGGSFQPVVRLGCSPWNLLVTAQPQASNFGVGVRSQVLQVPPGARSCSIEFRWTPFNFSGPGVVGPFMGLYMRAEDPSKQEGMGVSTFYARGGYSARDMAADLLATNELTIATYLTHIRQLQPERKQVLVRISTGVNDRSEALPSVGPVGYLPGFSPEAFKENIEVIINRVRGVWVSQGWPADELSFLITVSPPIKTLAEEPVGIPDDPLLIAYREQAAQIARENPGVAALRMDEITSAEELLALGWYLSPADRFHFTLPGYEGLALREIDTVLSSLCAADFSRDGGIDGTDVQQFFEAWEAGRTKADVNFDGAVEGRDIETFFTAWSQGGC